MTGSIDISAILILLILIVQDFKLRKISWVLLPLLFTAFGLKAFLSLGPDGASILFLKNLGFLLLQFLALFVFYFLKERKPVSMINHKIGMGDILFFIAICPAMSLLNFLFYYLAGILGALVGYFLFRLFKKNSSQEVPLAGCLSFILILFISLQYFGNNFDLYSDSLITGFLTPWKQ